MSSSCLTGFTYAKIGGLAAGSLAAGAALGYVGPITGMTLGERTVLAGSGVVGGALVGSFLGDKVINYLPSQGPGEALSAAAGAGVALLQMGKTMRCARLLL